ncbi:MAG: penicillin-binding protein 2 [Bacteroidota bacterium]
MKDLFTGRALVLKVIFASVVIIYFIRLFYLQVISDDFDQQAKNNAIDIRRIEPARGLIYDRKGKLIVYNAPVYDIMVNPKNVKEMDTLKFCEILSITKVDFIKNLSKARSYSKYKSSVFLGQLSIEDFSKFQEYMSQFPGFYGNVRTMRQYPYNCGPNLFGYIGEVDKSQIEKSNGYYEPGDYAGKFALELQYDEELRGQMGLSYMFVDNKGREQGSLDDGKQDQKPIAGKSLTSTIDIDLQLYGEKLMKNKRGSIVAIEPSTGEVLCLVSSPSFDPNLLTGRKRGENYMKLLNDPQKPLINRPLTAMYPPGSTFKPFTALAAMTEGVVDENYSWNCTGGYYIPGKFLKCAHGHPSAGNVMDGLKYSCNPYFWSMFRRDIDDDTFGTVENGYQIWWKHMQDMGFGHKTGIDMPGEKGGGIPSVNYYNKIYGKGQWHSTTIISLAIGQGEILATPLQMANSYAAIANKGYYITPHLIKKIENDSGVIKAKFPIVKTAIRYACYASICEGLRRVVESGTAHACQIPSIELCGKTGTAQNSHGENHSLFAGYAPFKNPKISIAVIIENGGYGAAYAAPIVSLMVEKYLNDTIETSRLKMEKKMFEANLLNTGGYGKKKEPTE